MAYYRDQIVCASQGTLIETIPPEVFQHDTPEAPEGSQLLRPQTRKMFVIDGYNYERATIYRDRQPIEPLSQDIAYRDLRVYMLVVIPKGRVECHQWMLQTDQNVKPRILAKLDGPGGCIPREFKVSKVTIGNFPGTFWQFSL